MVKYCVFYLYFRLFWPKIPFSGKYVHKFPLNKAYFKAFLRLKKGLNTHILCVYSHKIRVF